MAPFLGEISSKIRSTLKQAGPAAASVPIAKGPFVQETHAVFAVAEASDVASRPVEISPMPVVYSSPIASGVVGAREGTSAAPKQEQTKCEWSETLATQLLPQKELRGAFNIRPNFALRLDKERANPFLSQTALTDRIEDSVYEELAGSFKQAKKAVPATMIPFHTRRVLALQSLAAEWEAERFIG